ncbi:hypothetical protein [Parasphingorhabdus marina]|uniref:hypothetical protein n=1 Tax=Parasphingorhabdus marina TaxID=394732 RepID=UPI00116151FD|nr:hypothetical protein [Parasphingorhabdus marina]
MLGAITMVIAGLGDDLRESEAFGGNQTQQARPILESALAGARFADENFTPLPRSENSLSFRMIAPAALQSQGYVQASLQISNRAGAKALLLQSISNTFPAVEILSGQKDIGIEYVEVPENDGEFIGTVVISYHGQAGGSANQIKIHPKINGRGACVFDVISQRCRS